MLNKCIEVLVSAILLVPVFALQNQFRFHDRKKTAAYFVFAVYLSAVYLLVGLPTAGYLRFHISFTLIPFLPMATDFRNTILNILL